MRTKKLYEKRKKNKKLNLLLLTCCQRVIKVALMWDAWISPPNHQVGIICIRLYLTHLKVL